MSLTPTIHHLGHLQPDPRWRLGKQRHVFHETIVLLAGRLHLRIHGQELAASAGDVLHYPAGAVHEERSDPDAPCEHYYIGWSGDDAGLPLRVEDRTGRMRTLLSWCEHDEARRLPATIDLRQDYFRLFFAEYRKAIAAAALPLAPMQRVIDHITAHMHQALTLDDLAAVAGLSRAHFVRAYKTARGITPMQDLRRHRIERARRLTITTELPLQAIAEQVGLANAYHLSRLFRRVHGVPPGAMRRRSR